MNQPIYLDYAAATPLDEAALSAMEPYFVQKFYNPSAVYQSGREIRRDLEAARSTVAGVLGAKDQEVIFTAGGTEANNLAIRGIMERFPDGHLVVSSIEHESVLETARLFPHTIVRVDKKGLLDVKRLEQAITDKTVLVSVMYANNEVGTIQPIKEVAALIRAIRQQRPEQPIYLHTDACQAANYLDLQVGRLGVDLMSLNGGKLYGPKQSGALYLRRGTRLQSQITGGGQEGGLRSGTEHVAAIIGFATMLQKVQVDRKAESRRLQQIRDTFFATLSQNISHIQLNGHTTKRLPNNLNITIPGADGERLLMELDEAGIMVATGSACSASSDEPSHVLRAIGLSDRAAAASLRITFGRQTSEVLAAQAAQRILPIIRHQIQLV